MLNFIDLFICLYFTLFVGHKTNKGIGPYLILLSHFLFNISIFLFISKSYFYFYYHLFTLGFRHEPKIPAGRRVFVKEFNDNNIVCSKSGSRTYINIPLQNIVAISKRKIENLVLGSVGVATTGTALTAIIGLLSRESKSTASPNGRNGLAGVVGIVLAIVTTPLFIGSNYTFFKQLSHKKMDIMDGWKFTILN